MQIYKDLIKYTQLTMKSLVSAATLPTNNYFTNYIRNKNNLTSSNTMRSAGKRREASDFTTENNVCSALCWHSGSVTRMASSRAGISCGQLRGQSSRAILPIKTDNCTAIWTQHKQFYMSLCHVYSYPIPVWVWLSALLYRPIHRATTTSPNPNTDPKL